MASKWFAEYIYSGQGFKSEIAGDDDNTNTNINNKNDQKFYPRSNANSK